MTGHPTGPHHVLVPAAALPVAPADEHSTFIAGRYRDGALSDDWTDVTRCAWGTFTAYVPTCRCGWQGTPCTPDGWGVDRCLRQLGEHLAR